MRRLQTRTVLIKMFVELLISDNRLNLGYYVLEIMSADQAFLNSTTLQSYFCILKCIKIVTGSAYGETLTVSRLSSNPFLAVGAIKGMDSLSPVKELKNELELLLARYDEWDCASVDIRCLLLSVCLGLGSKVEVRLVILLRACSVL